MQQECKLTPAFFFISQVHVFILVVGRYGRKQCDAEQQGTGFKDLDIASAVNCAISRPDREHCGGKHLALVDAH